MILLVKIIALAVMYDIFNVVDYTHYYVLHGQLPDSQCCHHCIPYHHNVPNTILLAARNFSMQCLGSPSREEV